MKFWPKFEHNLSSGREVGISWDALYIDSVEGLMVCRLLADGTMGPDITENVSGADMETIMEAIHDWEYSRSEP